jgi:hypothetical protein
MASSRQQTLGPMEVRSPDRARSTAVKSIDPAESTSVDSVDRGRELQWLGLVARAFGRCGLTHKAAAITMDTDAGLLSAQLSGVPNKHLSFRRMHALPPEFWRELILLILDFHEIAVGASQRDQDDAAIGRAIREVVARCR